MRQAHINRLSRTLVMLSPSLVILNPSPVILNEVKDLNSRLRINSAKHLVATQGKLLEGSQLSPTQQILRFAQNDSQ
jgi:hypothetical protein